MRQQRGPGCGCLGCGGSFLVVMVLLVALSWFMVIKPARDFIAGWQAPQTQSQTLPTPPPTGDVNAALNKADVEKFVRIRRKVRDALGSSFTSLQTLLNNMDNGKNPNIMQVMGALKDATASVGQARTAQAAALNSEKMSLERYAVVRAGVNRALGVPNIDFGKVADALQKGQVPDLGQDVQTATEQEKALIAPFKAELNTTAAAGLLGL